MKLVEILAREVNEWPEDCESMTQDSWRLILSHSPSRCNVVVMKYHTRAEDKTQVTRAQWEAERARIAAMEGISAFSQEQANAEAEREHVAQQYEQELWDRVALAAIQGVVASDAFHNHGNFQGHPDNAAFFGAEVADAFMKERAMRAKQ